MEVLKPSVSDVVKATADNYLLQCFCTKATGFRTYCTAAGYTYNPNDFSVIFLLFFVFKPKGFEIFSAVLENTYVVQIFLLPYVVFRSKICTFTHTFGMGTFTLSLL